MQKEQNMRSFDYSKIPGELLCSEIINLLTAIREYKGKQELFIEAKPNILNAMLEISGYRDVLQLVH